MPWTGQTVKPDLISSPFACACVIKYTCKWPTHRRRTCYGCGLQAYLPADPWPLTCRPVHLCAYVCLPGLRVRASLNGWQSSAGYAKVSIVVYGSFQNYLFLNIYLPGKWLVMLTDSSKRVVPVLPDLNITWDMIHVSVEGSRNFSLRIIESTTFLIIHCVRCSHVSSMFNDQNLDQYDMTQENLC